MFHFRQNILQAREYFKARLAKRSNKLKKPKWMLIDDPLIQIIHSQNKLFEEGQVYYASLLQANVLLFNRFPAWDCGADIVYSTDPYFDSNPLELTNIAASLFSYKNAKEVPPELKTVVKAITKEKNRLLNAELPHSITNGRNVYYTSIIVFRKHIPKKKLIGAIFPVIANPKDLSISTILPHCYWTDDLKKYYCQE